MRRLEPANNQFPLRHHYCPGMVYQIMDRQIDPNFRRHQIIKRTLIAFACLALTVVIFIWAPGWIKPSISRARLRTARVDRGSIESTITASGTIVPEVEQVVSSPIDSRVIKILKRPSDQVTKGDPILQLDVSVPQLSLEKINQDLAIKQNQQAKKRLDLKNNLDTLESQSAIKNLDHLAFKAAVVQNRQLFEKGVISADEIKQSELQEAKAALELNQLNASRKNAQAVTQTEIEGLALEIQTLLKEKTEAERQLNLATTKSDRDGVLTWVVAEEGATIHKGDAIARVADLHSFRIDASVSDVHANRLAVGLPIKVKIGEEYLIASLSNILPTIQNGVMTITAALMDKASPLLRANMRVDVLIITDNKGDSLRIKKGPALSGEGEQDVYVLRGGTSEESAVRTRIRLGISSFDQYEVVSGLSEGDEVIISDMKDYMSLREVKVK